MRQRKIFIRLSYCNRILNVICLIDISSCFYSMPWSLVWPWFYDRSIDFHMAIQVNNSKLMYSAITLISEVQIQSKVKHILRWTWPQLLLSLNPCLFSLKLNINLIDTNLVRFSQFFHRRNLTSNAGSIKLCHLHL